MPRTRPSGIPIVSGSSALVVQETAEIDERGRLYLAPRWVRRIDWLQSMGEVEVEALVTLTEPGRLSIDNWEPKGPKIEERYVEIAATADDDRFELLRLIQDRYVRLKIKKDRRPYLGNLILSHLELPITRGAKSTIYIVLYPSRIDLLSQAYRTSKLLAGDARLDDLP